MPSRARVKSRGLGDTIAHFTEVSGIKAVVEFVSEVVGQPCGCNERQEVLNNIFPYKEKENGDFIEHESDKGSSDYAL